MTMMNDENDANVVTSCFVSWITDQASFPGSRTDKQWIIALFLSSWSRKGHEKPNKNAGQGQAFCVGGGGRG